MITTLRVRNLAIIEDLSIEFGPGLNVLTGETGAGKSIVVDALGLVAGSRGERGLVRDGEARLCVEALFDLSAHPALEGWLAEHGLEATIGELLIRREVAAEGSGRAWLGGSPCTQGLLRELGSFLIELHGQDEHRHLLDAARQGELLDGFGACAESLGRVRRGWSLLREAQGRLEALRGRVAERESLLSAQRSVAREIEVLAPRAGELAELELERRLLQNSGKVAEWLDQVIGLSDEGEPSARSLAAAAATRADELAELDGTLAESAARLAAAALELQDLGQEFRAYRQRREFDAGRLEALEDRRAELRRLCLRHAVDEAGLVEIGAQARREIAELESLEESEAAAGRELASAQAHYDGAARELSGLRGAAAPRLAQAVAAQLEALALGRAKFEVQLEGQAPSAAGVERATFLLAANPGEPIRPLSAVASGGELSRILLALHVVGSGVEAGRVLVFDEVDVGIGGAVADAVGARLARLARGQQVLCVTHLPQIAAWADRHLRVGKTVVAGRTQTRVELLSAAERVEELARMLGGRRTTPTSRRHASELLEAARCGTRAHA